MVEYIPGLKKGFIVIGIVCLLVVLFLLVSYNDSYYANKFEISINDNNIIARYRSEYSEVFLVNNTYDGYINSYSKTSDLLYEIPKSDKYILKFNEYEAYNKFGNRDSYSFVSKSARFESVNNSKNTLKVERLGKVLYEGELINDLSNIITEEGRYYFHIYNNSKRSTSPFAKVKTNLSFNVLVVPYDN